MSLPKGSTTEENDDDFDDVPLQHQRPFGAGLHRKPVAFVSASASGGQLKSIHDAAVSKPKTDVANLYLSMVLPEDTARSKSAPPAASSTTQDPPPAQPDEACTVCKLPLGTDMAGHEQSFAHQVCLPHSQPPSALDRSRMGLAYLSAFGWDPDARKGLGASQQGIQYPIKPKVKEDNLGIGMEVPKGLPPPKKKEQLLDAKKVRKMALEEKKRTARIREQLFGDGRLEKYLGPGAV